MRAPAALAWIAFAVACASPSARAAEPARAGLGSYAVDPPPGIREPPPFIYRTDRVRGPMPTTDWWSSLAWVPFSMAQYPHPLAVQAASAGLRVAYPGPGIAAAPKGIFGGMGGDDLVLGHSGQDTFPDARVDGFSDWFVSARFGDGKGGMTVTYGHGSPFVYARFDGGSAKIAFPRPPEVWSGNASGPVLGVLSNGRPYALFGPSGSTWDGLGTKTLVNQAGGKRHFSLAVLPEKSEEALALFRKAAHAHVTDTRVAWRYDPATRSVVTTFAYTTAPQEGGAAAGTLFALYPHQWRATSDPLLKYRYASVRGAMKLGEGASFTTRTPVPPLLPALPVVGGGDRAAVQDLVRAEAQRAPGNVMDTYAEGKMLGRMAAALSIAEQTGPPESAAALRDALRARLEQWFAAGGEGRAKAKGLFYYNRTWGTLIGCPPSFGTDADLNDHHFHYGYFLRAAADVARHDPAWAGDARWGGMIRMLVRDIASPDRQDDLFPFLRCFDPYAGHSWASGHAKFGDGNNQESSSEAMNAWYGILMLGEATGDAALRDLGLYLYAMEAQAADEYWFDVHGENFPPACAFAAASLVWGGKTEPATWFSAKPVCVHGIVWLPLHGGSLYLGTRPDYVRKNYDALVRESKGERWDEWEDLVWMYLALADAGKARTLLAAREAEFKPEGGNSRANAVAWIRALEALGTVDREVTAPHPASACFRKGSVRTHVVYNFRAAPLRVAFSDGAVVEAKGKGFALK